MKRRIWQATSLLTVSSAFALALCEVGLRLDHYESEGRFRITSDMEYDRLLGWQYVPGASFQLKTREYNVSMRYNARGFRGPDWPLEKPRGMRRIIAVGDSFTLGTGVPAEERFTDLLEQELGQTQVINLGVIGYSTDQEMLVLEQEGWQYSPDDVVLEVYYNDIWANGSKRLAALVGTQPVSREKPLFLVSRAGGLTLTNVPVPYHSRPYVQQLRTYDLFRTVAWLGLQQAYSHRHENTLDKPLAEDMIVYTTKASPEIDNAWNVTHALLRRIQQECLQHHAHLLVLYVPTKFELSAEEWQRWRFSSDWSPRQVATSLQSICQTEGIPYIDLSDRFKPAVADLYFARDPHWTAAGHQLAAHVLSRVLE